MRAAVTIGTATTIFCGTYPFTAQAAITSGPEVEALKQLKMDYFANVDLNNWPALYQQFTPNALIDASDSLTGGLGPVFHGRNQFIAFNTLVLTLISTHHEGYNPVITVADDGTTATGVWQMNDRLSDPFNIIGLRGHGVYTDSYVKNGNTWVVDKSTLVYHQQYIEILPGILMTGPRELVHGERESFIGGYRWQRSGLGVGSPRLNAGGGGCSRVSSR